MSWETTGNAGTDPVNDFVGTTDEQPLILRTNDGEALRINPDGRVGVGTTAPASQLEIVGNWNDGQLGALKLTGDKPSIKFAGGTLAGNESWALHLGSRGPGNLEFLRQTGPLAFDHVLALTPTGRVGIGTSTPSSQMEIVGNWNDGQLGALKLTGDKPSIKFAGGTLAGNESWALHLGSRGPGNLEFLRQTGPLAFDHVLALTPTGRVGIGTSTPSGKLEVVADSGIGVLGRGAQDSGVVGLHGDPRLQETQVPSGQAGVFGASDLGSGVVAYTRNRQAPAIFAQGGLRSVASLNAFAGDFEGDVRVNGKVTCEQDIVLPNADCAEDFDISGEITAEPGTVMVLNDAGEMAASSQAYDRRVGGVVSGAGHFRPGIVLDRRETGSVRQPIALLGKTFCKVDAQFGAIAVGDLLTTSPTPGHAMATKDPVKSFGAVIGKAMRPFVEGQGVIPILIALQ